jgi:hypothetical protein
MTQMKSAAATSFGVKERARCSLKSTPHSRAMASVSSEAGAPSEANKPAEAAVIEVFWLRRGAAKARHAASASGERQVLPEQMKSRCMEV